MGRGRVDRSDSMGPPTRQGAALGTAPLRSVAADVDLLRCPETGQELRSDGKRLITEEGARAFPVIEGIPYLLSSDNPLFKVPQERHRGPSRGVKRRAESIAARLLRV